MRFIFTYHIENDHKAEDVMRKLTVVLSVLFSVFFLSQCKAIQDILDPEKDYGEYTSITLQFTITFKGLNSTGQRSVKVHETTHINEGFVYTKKYSQSDDINCNNAETDKTHTFQTTVNAKAFKIILAYNDWAYYGVVNNGTNYKLLCSDWTASIVSYTYTSGKDDPGSPLVNGLDQLNLNVDNHCTGTIVHDCLTEADISVTRNTTKDKKHSTSVFTTNSNFKSTADL